MANLSIDIVLADGIRQYADCKRRICGSMRVAEEEYAAVCGSSKDEHAAVCGSSKDEHAAVCGVQEKNMRQYADCKRRVCGSMRNAKEDYAAICGSCSDVYSSSCGSRCIFLIG